MSAPNVFEQRARAKKVRRLVAGLMARPMSQTDDESIAAVAAEIGVNAPSAQTCEMVRLVLSVLQDGLQTDAA